MPRMRSPMRSRQVGCSADDRDCVLRGDRGAGRMRVLIACEFSGIVRDAFAAHGHYAMSCDLLPSETPGQHSQADVRDWLEGGFGWDWHLMIAFPPCTHLAASGARWWKDKEPEQYEAICFVAALAAAPIPRIAIENPIGALSRRWRPPDQIIQPWQFGHGETKATCLWLKGLPPLVPTHTEEPDLFCQTAPAERIGRVWREPPGPDRWKNRSRTYAGIAEAMAAQWCV